MQADLTILFIVGIGFFVLGLLAGFVLARCLPQPGPLEVQAPQRLHLNDALTDSLTGLPNRRAFDEQLLRQWQGWQERGIVWSLLMIDIDHFKPLNDSCGHLAGDQALVHVATVIRATMRQSDMVARYGGDEFAVILPEAGAMRAGLVADRARIAVQQTELTYDGQQISVTISCGAANVESSDDCRAVLKRADQALYRAKQTGRNRTYAHKGADLIAIDPAQGSVDVV